MRLSPILRATLILSLSCGVAMLAACGKSSDAAEVTAESIDKSEDTLIEDHDGGSIVWQVAPDGKVSALVKSADGKPVEKDVSGTLTWKGSGDDFKVPMALDEKEKVLTAAGPKLEGELTQLKYEVVVDGKTWSGALHLPAGGTKQLADSARVASAKELKGKTGPNGGVIQVVGEDVVEVVADKKSGEVRVYVLDADLKPVEIGERKIKLGVVGSSVETVVLTPGPDKLYVVGKLGARVDPVKLTVAITVRDRTEVVLVGHRPGVHVVVGSRAPSLRILVDVGWKVRGPGVIVVDDDDDDDIHVHFHGHGHGRGRWK